MQIKLPHNKPNIILYSKPEIDKMPHFLIFPKPVGIMQQLLLVYLGSTFHKELPFEARLPSYDHEEIPENKTCCE